jgi:hypothetical protein
MSPLPMTLFYRDILDSPRNHQSVGSRYAFSLPKAKMSRNAGASPDALACLSFGCCFSF